MDSAKLNDRIQVVGIFAVVASLIFVGLQMKQSHEIAVADQYQDRADAALDFYLALMQSDQALTMTGKDFSDAVKSGRAPVPIMNSLESEGPEGVAMRHLIYRSYITKLDNYHFQYENGFLSEEAWQAFRLRLKLLLSRDIYAALYSQMSGQFRPSFHDICSQIMAEIDAASKLETDQ
jgi:hypothetical protein